MEHILSSLEELESYATRFLADTRPETEHATLIGLRGDLGSGKTAFVKAIAKALGVRDSVLSPTYVIVKSYDLSGRKWDKLVHIDAYRMENPRETRTIRFAEIAADPRNLVFVEWPERMEEFFPHQAPILSFYFINETTRKVVE